ncbi:MAG TPA: B12-binding domain-containing radical SAM protein, partial [Acidobacteriota bacterium]|nr:B12-binding domain-containing radical SAM protein [Acidobacteriota bacterium]
SEQIEDIKETVRFLKEARPDQFLTTVAYPIKGTPYYESVSNRIVAVNPWEKSSDRELQISGRQSSRFYAAANRWLVGEMQYQRLSRSAHWDFPALGKALLNRELGRIGMLVTHRQ